MPVARLFRANLEACWYFWAFIAVELFFWLLFYVL